MARLPQGVRKRADGAFEKRFTVEGKRYSVTARSLKDLQDKEQEKREKIKAGLLTGNKDITLNQYYEEWKARKRKEIRGSTLLTYNSVFQKHISPVLGKMKVQKIERRQIIALLNSQERARDFTAILLCIILNEAVRDEIIVKNPAAAIKAEKRTRPKAAETIHRALTEEEQKAFMQEAQSEWLYEFLAFLLCTGMRMSEAAALEWKDIDRKAGFIHVNKTATYRENGERTIGDSTKTAAGVRDIPLTAAAEDILRRQRAKLGNIRRITGGRIFESATGGIIQNPACNTAIQRTLQRLEEKGTHIERFTAHALRDTFATRAIEQGMNPQTLKTILGHESLAMTMDLYAHVLPNTKAEEMNRVMIAL